MRTLYPFAKKRQHIFVYKTHVEMRKIEKYENTKFSPVDNSRRKSIMFDSHIGT
jgi:hypothetical protein